MQVRDIMSHDATYIVGDTPLVEAARKMEELDCGFLPIADTAEAKLRGVVTDRDIVTRGIANALDIDTTPVSEISSPEVLYCYESDSVEDAAASMRDQRVYRLVVLDGVNSKRLSGIVTLADITRAGATGVLARTAPEVARA